MTRKELYNICHDEAVAYANSEQWSKRTGEEKSFLIQGYLDAMMEARKSEITEKKREYPKTYDECCKILGLNSEITDSELLFYYPLKCGGYTTIRLPEMEKFEKFIQLYLCRNAYWKIAGEKMGLGKPWEPDWEYDDTKYVLFFNKNEICHEMMRHTSYVLAFPTEEMRDAFKENFDPDIEFCKEFL